MNILATYVEPRIPGRGVAGTWQDIRGKYWLLEVGYINGHKRYVRQLDESLPLHHFNANTTCISRATMPYPRIHLVHPEYHIMMTVDTSKCLEG